MEIPAPFNAVNPPSFMKDWTPKEIVNSVIELNKTVETWIKNMNNIVDDSEIWS